MRKADELQRHLCWKFIWRLLQRSRKVSRGYSRLTSNRTDPENRCGSGESFCGKGSCQDGTCEGGFPYSTDGKCGRDYDYLPCPPKFGLCCSAAGQCGNQTQFCTTGCQSGPCLVASTTSSLPPSATPSSKPPGGVSPDGTCAYNNGYTCKGSTNGDCCSSAGYCGKTEYECSKYLGW